MNTTTLFEIITWVVYGMLASIAVWGTYCVIFAWRRVSQSRFRSEEHQEEFLEKFDESLFTADFEAAIELCRDDRRAMPQLALFAVANRKLGYDRIRSRIVEHFQRHVISDLEHRLSWVATVIKSAPMIGLLGTVMGMMGAFSQLATGDQVDPTQMAEDIGFALITTACGLAIAIPLVLCTASINIRIRKMEDLVSAGLVHLFDTLKTVLGTKSK